MHRSRLEEVVRILEESVDDLGICRLNPMLFSRVIGMLERVRGELGGEAEREVGGK